MLLFLRGWYKPIVLCWSQAIDNQGCGWMDLCGSYNNCKMCSAITHQETLKEIGLLLTGPGNLMVHLGSHSKVMDRDREQAWVLILLVWRVGA